MLFMFDLHICADVYANKDSIISVLKDKTVHKLQTGMPKDMPEGWPLEDIELFERWALQDRAIACQTMGVRCTQADRKLSFEHDIKPLFRAKDIDSMAAHGLHLDNYTQVKSNAELIYQKLRTGDMPCDGAWPLAKVNIFLRWMKCGALKATRESGLIRNPRAKPRNPVKMSHKKIEHDHHERATLLERFQANVHVAAQIELTTIPLYLSAMWSIWPNSTVKPAVRQLAQYAQDTLKSVVIQEMLHMTLDGNVLAATGEPLDMYPKMVPKYPADLGAVVGLRAVPIQSLTGDQMQAFVQIERPNIDRFHSAQPADPCNITVVSSIGEFYDLAQQCAKVVDERYNQPFAGVKITQILSWLKDAVNVTNYDTVKEAFKIIVDQGEGHPGHDQDNLTAFETEVIALELTARTKSAQDTLKKLNKILAEVRDCELGGGPSQDKCGSELSHFSHFQLVQAILPQIQGCIVDASAANTAETTNPFVKAADKAFNALYMYLLLIIEDMYDTGLRGYYDAEMHVMRDMMGSLARDMMLEEDGPMPQFNYFDDWAKDSKPFTTTVLHLLQKAHDELQVQNPEAKERLQTWQGLINIAGTLPEPKSLDDVCPA